MPLPPPPDEEKLLLMMKTLQLAHHALSWGLSATLLRTQVPRPHNLRKTDGTYITAGEISFFSLLNHDENRF